MMNDMRMRNSRSLAPPSLLLRSGPPLSHAAAARAVADVADALRYCHWQGVCHGDVKPDNMLSGADGRVRLTDFSVSQARPSRIGSAMCRCCCCVAD